MPNSLVPIILSRSALLRSPAARNHSCRAVYAALRQYATDHSPPSSTPAPAPAPGAAKDTKKLPSDFEKNRSGVAKSVASRLDNLQAVVFNAGQQLNDLTGYSGIEALKKAIEEQENNVTRSRAAVQQANEDYKAAIAQRSASQKEVNELLQRKHSWSGADLERFTSLYRSDHVNEQAEALAHQRLTEAEKEADDARTLLSSSILTRYHEEQIWSDKIRRASTWGTWGIMGFNVLLFIVVQLGLEPWKRRRLVGNFEEKVRSVLKEEGMHKDSGAVTAPSVVEVVAAPDVVEIVEEPVLEVFSVPEAVVEPPPYSPARAEQTLEESLAYATPIEDQSKDSSSVFDQFAAKAKRLFSDEQLSLRQVDVTTIALQGAACGAIIMGTVLSLVYRR